MRDFLARSVSQTFFRRFGGVTHGTTSIKDCTWLICQGLPKRKLYLIKRNTTYSTFLVSSFMCTPSEGAVLGRSLDRRFSGSLLVRVLCFPSLPHPLFCHTPPGPAFPLSAKTPSGACT